MDNIFNQYHPYNYRHRRIDLSLKITASNVVLSFIKERLVFDEILPDEVLLEDFRIRTLQEVHWVISHLCKPSSRYASLFNIQSQHQNWQCFDFVPSNLGYGYLFYFICNGCTRRVKDLYKPEGQLNYLCRTCHKLSYSVPKALIQ